MRRLTALFIGFTLLLTLFGVSAYALVLPEQKVSLDYDFSRFTPVLTRDNLGEFEDFFILQGTTSEGAKIRFEEEGVVLRAYDGAERVLTLYAQKDGEAAQYFNVNEISTEDRGEYRRLHSSEGSSVARGLNYTSVKWGSYPSGRWLNLEYVKSENGKVAATGVQRRTIVNGTTFTWDLQTLGKGKVKDGDRKILDKILKTFQFTAKEPMPELPIKLVEKKTAPAETSQNSFVLQGVTEKNAKLTAVLGSMSTTNTTVFETEAKASGAYTLEIKLPQEDIYMLSLTVQKEGKENLEKQYAVTYRKGLMDVTVSKAPDSVLTDKTVISGKAAKGTKLTLTVNDKTTTKTLTNKTAFTFETDTSKDGDYTFRLVAQKDGMEDRTFVYTGKRTVTEAERRAQVIDAAQEVSYAKLKKSMDTYDGKVLKVTGTVLSNEEKAGEWLVLLAGKGGAENPGNVYAVVADKNPGWSAGADVTLYGKVTGTVSMLDENKADVEYPRLQLVLWGEE